MRYDIAKKKLVKRGILSAIILLLASGIFWGATAYKNHKVEELNKLESEKLTLLVRYSKTKEEQEKIKQDYRLYKLLGTHKKSGTNGLTLSAERIREIRKAIEPLQKRYFISNLNLSLTPVETKKAINNNRELTGVELFANTVTLTFSAFTDELALSFLHDIGRDIKGQSHFKSMTINRVSNSLDMNPSQPEITVKANMDWLIMKDKS